MCVQLAGWTLLVVVCFATPALGARGPPLSDEELALQPPELEGIEPLTAVLRSEATGTITQRGVKQNRQFILHVASLCGFSRKEIGQLRQLTKAYSSAAQTYIANGDDKERMLAQRAFDDVLDMLHMGPELLNTRIYASSALNHIMDLAQAHGYSGARKEQLQRELKRYNGYLISFYQQAKQQEEHTRDLPEHELASMHASKLQQVDTVLKRLEALKTRILRAGEL